MSRTDKGDRVLYFFTDEYPYANGETFIENEIETLADAFGKIVIITKNVNSNRKRKTPDNVSVIRNNFGLSRTEKLSSIAQIFSNLFLKEFSFLLKNKIPLSKTNIAYMLLSLKRGKKISKFISQNLPQDQNLEKVYLYSYWSMDESIGISLFKRKNKRVKAFTRAHRMDLYFYSNPNGYLPYKQLILDSLDAFYSISKDGETYLKKILNLRLNNKVKISYLGTKPYSTIKEISLASDSKKIMSCSNIYPNKRVHLIADSFQFVDAPIEWSHYGEYMGATEEAYKTKLRLSVDSLNQSKHQGSLKGRLSNIELLEELKKVDFDLFVNVSESEGVPVSIMEAFSFGIPVIATNVGGVSEIVIDNHNGFLLPPDVTAEEIASKINYFYSLDNSTKNTFRKNAFETWNKKFNSDVNYKEFINNILAL